ncbi:hypothetical protein CGZ95_14720 [Enemella evansiae]|uniref:hypothetical protein n=1 Tax=Enemella evansiae TaxID=2016499 RepID=UPI000B964E7E|nr:hypothetical protein [Enemella evansiae]OYN98407.1 hypothetical protein CGZ95_14720 [Enemella evansiae]
MSTATGEITADGSLVLRYQTDPRREFAARMRHQVNPLTGVVCGLIFCACLFLVAVQLLFSVRPSVIALVVMLLCVVVYAIALVRARAATSRVQRRKVVLDDRGLAVAGEQGPPVSYGWPRFTRWQENDTDFMVISRIPRQPAMTIVLPLTETAFDDELRDLLHAHIDPDDDPIDEAFIEMDWDEEPDKRNPDAG